MFLLNLQMNAAKGKPGDGFQLYFVPDTIPNKLNRFFLVQNINESLMTCFPLAAYGSIVNSVKRTPLSQAVKI